MSVLTLIKQCFQIVGMIMTVWVVTWFEIVQGYMQNANTAFLFTSVGLGAMTVQVIKYIQALPDEINPPETTVLWVLFGLSLVCVVTALIGFYGAWVEHSKILLAYAFVTG